MIVIYYSHFCLISILTIYSIVYQICKIVVEKGDTFIGALLDRDIKLYLLSPEMQKSLIMHISLVLIGLLFITIPSVHLLIYFIFYQFVDVHVLNFITFVACSLKLIYNISLVYQSHEKILDDIKYVLKHKQVWYDYFTCMYFGINLYSVDAFYMSMFHLIDILFESKVFISELYRLLNVVLSIDIETNYEWFNQILIFVHTYKKYTVHLRLVFMILILFLSKILLQEKTISYLFFGWYVIFRLCTIAIPIVNKSN